LKSYVLSGREGETFGSLARTPEKTATTKDDGEDEKDWDRTLDKGKAQRFAYLSDFPSMRFDGSPLFHLHGDAP
jgi:hypothetical protein